MYRIIIDAMGGDNAPQAVIEGTLLALKEYDDISVVFTGKEEVIKGCLEGQEYDTSRVEIIDAREEIEMAESPVAAVRTKKDSSMVVGMKMAAEGKGDVFITAGSTGAAVAGGTFVVRRAPNVLRPALAPLLPSKDGHFLLVDCGANVDCKPEFLQQFAIMGSLYMKAVEGIESPRVGLLNNGAEEEKGNSLTKEAHQLLKETDINFVGNAEGRDVFSGDYDVIVCDGFDGNVLMKSVEGCAQLLLGMMKDNLMGSLRTKMGALLAKPAFKALKKTLDYTEYGGALLLGTRAGFIKAHGSSNAKAIKNTVIQARNIAKNEVISKITAELEKLGDKEE